jgi:hypothetical protein
MAKTHTDLGVDVILDFYASPGAMTAAGPHLALIDALPADVAGLVRVVQGVAIHEYMAAAYGVTLPEQRKVESHIRPVSQMLDRILAIDGRSLAVTRPPEKRLVGVCQHFASLIVGLLRAKGIPARARYGFGSYFNPGYFEEHIVCEYWNAAEGRWILIDPQFDEVWRSQLKIDHNILDVPRDRFLVAGDAWTQYRSGQADPSKFGIFVGDLRGVWFIAGELLRDLAALNKMELLPWDQWGAMPRPDESLQDDQMAFYDQLAALTGSPDGSFEEMRRRYQSDDRVRVPATVFNALLKRPEAVPDSTD